jgi:N-acetylglucosaminyl-diphospho-decaprenol L-rhamnosyltransferase
VHCSSAIPESLKRRLEDFHLSSAAVIVTYNSAAEISTCLKAATSWAPEMSLIVVDNASTDSTIDEVRRFQNVHLIQNASNRGFAAGVNQGVKTAQNASVVLLLNPDAEILTRLEPLIEAAHQHGLSAGQLVEKTGEPQTGFSIRRFPSPVTLVFEVLGLNRLWSSNPVNRRYRCLDLDLRKSAFVEQPAGAFLMARSDVWQKLGGMDERFYPVWFEDVDFCKRAVDAGYRIAYVPEVKARHAGAHSLRKVSGESRAVYWYGSLLKYSTKHYRAIGYRAVSLSVMLSSVPRAIAGMIQTRSVAAAVAHAKIFWVAFLYLVNRPQAGAGTVVN